MVASGLREAFFLKKACEKKEASAFHMEVRALLLLKLFPKA